MQSKLGNFILICKRLQKLNNEILTDVITCFGERTL